MVSNTPASGRVLVVDDDPTLRRFLARFLASQGYQVGVAGNGHEALAQIAARPRTSSCWT